MSRIGKMPVVLPDGVSVRIKGDHIFVKGPLGELDRDIVGNIGISQQDNELLIEAKDDDRQTRAFHGLMRSLVNNMVVGVSLAFKKELSIIGIGYRGEAKGDSLIFNVGYSHPVDFPLPKGITGTVSKQGEIELKGIDKELLGDVAARIRRIRPPDAYKGKGIRYKDEYIKLKPGKSAVKG
ncbi:MAG: 50S ribosomal protein L6 [Thermodesulfobacteriota bacterium]|nr:50S ribosomal protein L6 [Thermodesulfobacteriota bacterium]